MSVDAGKERALAERLAGLSGAVVAFSGGVDSAVLLHAAVRALGAERVLAVTARSPSLPAAELVAAERVACEVGALHRIVDTAELERDGYRANGPDRCWFCKTELFEVIDRQIRAEGERRGWPVLFGAIADDAGDHRPGAAAARARGVLAPLADGGWRKADVRAYARAHGLSVADKPSFACLASRVPYGTEVHAGVLARLERSERVLHELGFGQVRVRHHDNVARIEVEAADIARVVALRETIAARLREAGYAYVAVDLVGYRSGAMNEVLGSPAPEPGSAPAS